MKKIVPVLVAVILAHFLNNGCVKPPMHPAIVDADLPKLIPLRHFFVNEKSSFNYKVSPDGKKLAWIAVRDRRLTILFKTIGLDDVKVIDTHSRQSVFNFHWLPDSQRIIYGQDQEGNENYHIHLVDTRNPDRQPINLTPFDDTRAQIHQIIRSDPENILVSHNRRNKSIFDLYRVNLETAEHTMIARNPGDVLFWITDDKGHIRARVIKASKEKLVLALWAPRHKTWKSLISWGLQEDVHFLSFTADNKAMWVLSNRGRDRIALVRLDLEKGEEKLVYEQSDVDLSFVLISYSTKKPLVAAAFPDYQYLHFFDDETKMDAQQFYQDRPVGLYVMNTDFRERIMTVTAYTDKSVDYYLYNRDTRRKVLLSRNPISVYEKILSNMKPVSFKSRDGLDLHGYLTIPKGTSGHKLPMVLFVHGGPWHRDYWGYHSTVQFLANRGYVVLQINFRGSTGYGRAFKEAAIGEFSGKMHSDLIDAVNWAVSKGIADPEKIAIYGHSYGGYATLVGVTFTPNVFACGVDVYGPSNLISLIQSVPKYWKNWMFLWYKYVGNPENPEDRAKMKATSPLFKVDRIKKPLLIAQGANDPRVKQKESDQMVEALRKAGKEVEYILFPDEGHSLRHWKNRLLFYRKMEDFLAQHLGGRSAGFDYYELGRLIY